jgi:HSP20 family protein
MKSMMRKDRNETGMTPRNMFSDFFNDVDRMFGNEMFVMPMPWNRGSNGSMPAANLRETEKEFAIELAVPGMKREDFEIEMENNVLSISCHKEEKVNEEKDGYKRREYNYSSFNRAFRLPEEVNTDKIKAQYDNGVLHINVPKARETVHKKKRIDIE